MNYNLWIQNIISYIFIQLKRWDGGQLILIGCPQSHPLVYTTMVVYYSNLSIWEIFDVIVKLLISEWEKAKWPITWSFESIGIENFWSLQQSKKANFPIFVVFDGSTKLLIDEFLKPTFIGGLKFWIVRNFNCL